MSVDTETTRIALAVLSLIGAMVTISKITIASLGAVVRQQIESSGHERKALLSQQDRITTMLGNHLASVGRSLTLVEERLAAADTRAQAALPVFYDMKSGIDFIKDAIVNSTIVPPGTKATVEPMVSKDTPAMMKEIADQAVERGRAQVERDNARLERDEAREGRRLAQNNQDKQ